jgi:hypothetical protein
MRSMLCIIVGVCLGFMLRTPAPPAVAAPIERRLPDSEYRERALRNGWITDGGGPRFIFDNVKIQPPRESLHTPGEIWIDVMIRNPIYNGTEEWKTTSVYFEK